LGVGVAGLLATLAETIWHTDSAVNALAGAGFLLVFALPIGLLVSVLGRVLVHAWSWKALTHSMSDDKGGAPRMTAWVLYLMFAAMVLAIGTHQGMRLLFANTRMNSTVVYGAPLVVLLVTLALLILSRPSVDLLERLVCRIEAARRSAGAPEMLNAGRVLGGAFLLASLVSTVLWLVVVSPRMGHLDLSFVRHLLLFALCVVVVPHLWQRWKGAHKERVAVALVVSSTTLLCLFLGAWLRYERPYKMLEIWGDTKLAGWAIDTIYDVQSVRVDLNIEGIEPIPLPGTETDAHPNVVIFTIDTVRADHVPMYGGTAKMPALEELSKDAAVFERAFSPGNVTRRSLPTLATGLSPRRVRGRIAGWALRMDPRHILLAERFRAGGYDTAGFFCCRSFFGRDHRLGLINGINHIEVEHGGQKLSDKAVKWLRKRGKSKKPLFLWTHFIEPHNWVKDHKPKDGSRRKSERYDKSLEATDGFLKRMMAEIRKQLGDNTIVVVTADHGEGLGDHGFQHHAGSLYSSEIRVPLVIAGPGVSATRIEQIVGLVDLAPTLLELAGFQAPGMPQMDGQSVAPFVLGRKEDKLGLGEAYSVIMADRSVAASQSAVMSGRYKLIEGADETFELYDMEEDPKEANDLKKDLPEVLAAMKARLERRKRIDRIGPF
jgi:arylsulfatase A-like enzyme